MRKTFVFIVCALLLMPTVSFATQETITEKEANVETDYQTGKVVFRQTQKLRSQDGREIYLFTNGKCELWNGDRKMTTCNYAILHNEIRIYGGGVEYKGTIVLSSNKLTIASLTLQGTTYYQKNNIFNN